MLRKDRKKHVMIYVQHLLGIGHLRRASLLADALANHNFTVDLVSGGMPVSGLTLHRVNYHQLPPVRSLDGQFVQLVDESDNLIDQDWKQRRCHALLELFEALSPDALITETFPFGRRMMRFELLPLLQVATQQASPPLVISSIRDILQPKSKPGRDQEILQWIEAYFDKILVHGDEHFASLGDTYSLAGEIADKTFYTGYISESTHGTQTRAGSEQEVLVSGGGGAASLPLLKTAIDAKSHSKLNRYTWRLLVGHGIDTNKFEHLRNSAGAGIIVERNRTDFPALLQQCAISVSQAGYNTVCDILKSGARAVMVPFSDAGEVEQSLRANLLQRHHRVISLEQQALTAESLAAAVDRASDMPRQSISMRMNGAEVSASLLQEWLHV
jgi:predicted glycosyltransferase